MFPGYSGEDSGPGKENEDWRAKPVARSLVRAPSDGVDNIQLPTHQSNGIQVNQNNCNVKNYQSTNFMLNNIGGTKRKEKHNTNSFYNNIKDVDGSKMNYDYTDTSTACNKNSNSNHSSPLQPRRGKYYSLKSKHVLHNFLSITQDPGYTLHMAM